MARRFHVPRLFRGEMRLDSVQAHHARSVLRLGEGETIEVFDADGNVASGIIHLAGNEAVAIRVQTLVPAPKQGPEWIVASAVPKGERADWLVEKLSELGTSEWVPLATARSVVIPEGRNKQERWVRIATESAKQSRRRGVMRISRLTTLTEALHRFAPSPASPSSLIAEAGRPGPPAPSNPALWVLSTSEGATAIGDLRLRPLTQTLVLLVGPEGGWTEPELAEMTGAGSTSIRLTDTVLRVETAAVAGAAIIAVMAGRNEPAASG